MPNVFPTVACSNAKTWNVHSKKEHRKELDAHMSVPLFLWNKSHKVCTFGAFCFLWSGFIKYLVKNKQRHSGGISGTRMDPILMSKRITEQKKTPKTKEEIDHKDY